MSTRNVVQLLGSPISYVYAFVIGRPLGENGSGLQPYASNHLSTIAGIANVNYGVVQYPVDPKGLTTNIALGSKTIFHALKEDIQIRHVLNPGNATFQRLQFGIRFFQFRTSPSLTMTLIQGTKAWATVSKLVQPSFPGGNVGEVQQQNQAPQVNLNLPENVARFEKLVGPGTPPNDAELVFINTTADPYQALTSDPSLVAYMGSVTVDLYDFHWPSTSFNLGLNRAALGKTRRMDFQAITGESRLTHVWYYGSAVLTQTAEGGSVLNKEIKPAEIMDYITQRVDVMGSLKTFQG